jgi:hypothetical protein
VWQPGGESANEMSTPVRASRFFGWETSVETLDLQVTVHLRKPRLEETSAAGQAERDIDLSGDLEGFFEELVLAARDERRVEATDAATAYVAGLLADYAKPGALNRDTLERPFTLLLAEAEESAGGERFDRLRALGDGVLYVRGLYAEHLETRGVALRYVSSVGARAYDGARHMLTRGGAANPAMDVFGELAERFDAFVELLGAVADRLMARGAGSNGAVVKLYERWLRTGAVSLGEALVAQGLVPVRAPAGVH